MLFKHQKIRNIQIKITAKYNIIEVGSFGFKVTTENQNVTINLYGNVKIAACLI